MIPQASIEFHGIPQYSIQFYRIPCNSMESHRIPWNPTEFHGIPWSSVKPRRQEDKIPSKPRQGLSWNECPVPTVCRNPVFLCFEVPPYDQLRSLNHVRNGICTDVSYRINIHDTFDEGAGNNTVVDVSSCCPAVGAVVVCTLCIMLDLAPLTGTPRNRDSNQERGSVNREPVGTRTRMNQNRSETEPV